jgi:hypothetical protein
MALRAKYLLVLLTLALASFGQIKVIKIPKVHEDNSKFGFGIGYARSVLYLARNVKNDNDARGFNAIISYEEKSYLRFTFEYTLYRSINIKPTWNDVKAKTFEMNVNVISKSKDDKYYFYPIAGLSYNVFSGYFTGINDYLNLSALYHKNQTVNTTWFGVNVGLGADVNFKGGCFYGNYKMRVGKVEGLNQINLMDVFMDVGIRFYVKKRTIGKLFRGTRSRYSLSKKTPSK